MAERGRAALYVSAVPTENTVDFYLRRGCTLLAEPDPDLLADEPDDIHLGYRIRPSGARHDAGGHG